MMYSCPVDCFVKLLLLTVKRSLSMVHIEESLESSTSFVMWVIMYLG